MKKILVVLLTTVGIMTAKSQDLRVGMQMSPTISYLSSDGDYLDKSSKIKFSWGFVTLYNFEDRNFGLMSGIDITTRGAKFSYENEVGEVIEARYKTQHLEIPVSIRMYTREIGYFSYWLKAGLAPSFELKENVDFYRNGVSFEPEDASYVKNFGLNLLLGVGTQYELSEETHLYLGLGYNNGLTNAFKNLEGYNDSGYFSHFALQLGVLF